MLSTPSALLWLTTLTSLGCSAGYAIVRLLSSGLQLDRYSLHRAKPLILNWYQRTHCPHHSRHAERFHTPLHCNTLDALISLITPFTLITRNPLNTLNALIALNMNSLCSQYSQCSRSSSDLINALLHSLVSSFSRCAPCGQVPYNAAVQKTQRCTEDPTPPLLQLSCTQGTGGAGGGDSSRSTSVHNEN